MKQLLKFIGMALLLGTMSLNAAEVTMDSTVKYQTIDGLGTAVASHVLGIADNQQIIDTLSNDLGMSMLRVYPAREFEAENDNDDPYDLDWSGFDFNGVGEDGKVMADQLSIIKKFQNTGYTPRIILSVFSPASWMKTNNSEIGGSLRHDMYEEFAEFYSAYVQGIKEKTGEDVYAISPENEPRWEQWYASCVYTYEEMRDIIKVLGRRFERDSIDVKIFSPEDLMGDDWIPWAQPWSEYYDVFVEDDTTVSYLDAIAVHTYEDGVAPSSPSAMLWEELKTAAKSIDKKVWMTETSGFDDSWDNEKGGFAVARALFSALKYGDCSAWVWLNPVMFRSFNPQEGLIIIEANLNYNYTLKYYALKQYYRYIRPGAVRIKCDSDDEQVQTIAFVHPEDNTVTVVLINTSQESKVVDLSGMDLPEMFIFRTSATEKCVKVGSTSGSVELPARSVTTLSSDVLTGVEADNGPVVPEKSQLQQNYPNPFNPVTTLQYTINAQSDVSLNIYNVLGEQVRTLVHGSQAAGNYSVTWDGTGANGERLGSGFYFYELRTGNSRQARKMLMLK